jgi:hypothetical protein
MVDTMPTLEADGFAATWVLRTPEEVDALHLERMPLP